MADTPTAAELFQLGREELFTLIALAEGYDVEKQVFVKYTGDEGEFGTRAWPWHRLGSIIFAVPSNETPSWFNMGVEERELIAGRVSALVEFAVAAATAPDERRHFNKSKPRKLSDIMPERFTEGAGVNT